MKLNLIFLAIGLILSASSKLLQYFNNSKIGNVVVIPAAIFFVLAVLFSIPRFTVLLEKENGVQQVSILAFMACLAVVSFQVMMILLIGHGNKLGFLLLIPAVLGIVIFIYKWN